MTKSSFSGCYYILKLHSNSPGLNIEGHSNVTGQQLRGWHNKFYRSILSTPYLFPFPISCSVLISLLNANSSLNLQPDSHERKIPFSSLLVMKKVFSEQNSLNGNFDIASCKKIPAHLECTFQCTQLQLLRTGRKYAIAVYYGCRNNTHDRPDNRPTKT